MTAEGLAGEGPRALRAPSLRRRAAAWLHARPRVRLGLLLAGPLGWLGIAYLGSLLILLLNAFWEADSFTGRVVPFSWTLDAFATLLSEPVYLTVALRTVLMAALVTLTDIVLAFPIAYYMARHGSGRCS
jgi:putative spermidine/putrescine transport system permease protein